MQGLWNWLAGAFLPWAASVLVALPAVLLALRSTPMRARALAWIAGLAVFFWVCLLLAFSGQAFRILPAPWQGMTLEALFALAAILLVVGAGHAALTWRVSPQAWRACGLATLGLLVFVALRALGLRALGLGGADGGAPGWEYLLFQATLPGIAEELAYRGVMQGGLNRVFGRPWWVFGARLGWGWVIVTLLFWGMHAFRVEPGGLAFHWPTLTMQLWAGAIFGWVRERSGSLLPAILSHNLTNIVWTLV